MWLKLIEGGALKGGVAPNLALKVPGSKEKGFAFFFIIFQKFAFIFLNLNALKFHFYIMTELWTRLNSYSIPNKGKRKGKKSL